MEAIRYTLETYGNQAKESFDWAWAYCSYLFCGTHTDQVSEVVPGWRTRTVQ